MGPRRAYGKCCYPPVRPFSRLTCLSVNSTLLNDLLANICECRYFYDFHSGIFIMRKIFMGQNQHFFKEVGIFLKMTLLFLSLFRFAISTRSFLFFVKRY